MRDMRVLFIGCNPSFKNEDEGVPFKGTKSGVTLDKWVSKLDLDHSQCSFMNLTKFATQSQKALRKSQINLDQFKFELGIKLIEAYHGKDRALTMFISAHQDQGKLADGPDGQIVPNEPKVVEADMGLIRETPLAKVVTLGKMAEWGFRALESGIPFYSMPHPSGLNHKLNDKEALEKTLADCKAWLYS